MATPVRITDGSLDFTGGVDTSRPTTAQGPATPHGLPRSKLSWLSNGTVRGGGIQQRAGWVPLCTVAKASAGIYNGGILYDQLTGNPYLLLSIGGQIFQVRVDTNNAVVNLSQQFANTTNTSTPMGYMVQAEQFVVMQSGDWTVNNVGTLPLIWDGTTLRRSVGIIGPNNTPTGGQKPYNEIPAALAMTYYQDRLFYANGRKFAGGDIVDGPSGSAQYSLSDSVLKVTENPLALGGDGFTVPTSAGQISGLSYTAQLDSTLGQGNLYIFTRRQVNAMIVPISRASWILAGNGTTASGTTNPTMLVALNRWGAAGDRSIIRENSDLFFTSTEPAIRSLIVATRYFQQWGNVPVSNNINRVMQQKYTNPTLLGQASGISFNNRLLSCVMPVVTPVGIAYQGIATLDFDLISTLDEQLPPAWEGIQEGLDVLHLLEGDFGGLARAFAVVHSRVDGSIQVWELTSTSMRDNQDSRVTMRAETPAYTWGKEFDLKRLSGGEIWIDKIQGTVDLTVEYRPDSEACWQPWMTTQFCAARTSCEDVVNPVCYPITPYCEGNRFPVTLPEPQADSNDTQNRRPTNIGYQFQVRLTTQGFCRVRGVLLHANPVERAPFSGLEGSTTPTQPVLTPIYYNTPQSCTLECPDGSPFTFTTAAGMFNAASQLLANTAAYTYACQQAQERLLCLGPLNPATATIGAPYTGMITATGGQLAVAPENNYWALNAGSALPPGLTFNGGLTPSAEVSITGTPTTSGNYSFGVTVTDPQGNTMSKQYSITVTCLTTLTVLENETDGGSPPFVGPSYNLDLSGDYNLWLINQGAINGSLTNISTITFTIQLNSYGLENWTSTFLANIPEFSGASYMQAFLNGTLVGTYNFSAGQSGELVVVTQTQNCVPATVTFVLVSAFTSLGGNPASVTIQKIP